MVFTVVFETYKLIWGVKKLLHRNVCMYVWPCSHDKYRGKVPNLQSTFPRNNLFLMFLLTVFSDFMVFTMVSGDGGVTKGTHFEMYVSFCMYNLPVFYRANMVLHTN